MRTVLGRHVILPLRNFAQEFGLGPTKAADGGNEPGAFIGRFTVLQNDDILRPADGHGLGKHFRSVFIGAVKLPHPPEVPGGEAGGVRIRGAQIFRSGNGGAFLWPVADQPANLTVQFHLGQVCRHQRIQRREHGAVVNRFSDVHSGFSFPAQVRLFFYSLLCGLKSPTSKPSIPRKLAP